MAVQQIANLLATKPVKATDFSSKESNFKSVLKDSIQSNSTSAPTTQTEKPEATNGLTEEQLTELKTFLETNDITQLAGGLNVLEQLLLDNNIDLASLVVEFLQVSEEELKALLTNLTNEDTAVISLEQLLQNLMNAKTEVKQLTPDSAIVVKAVKLYELLLANKQLNTDNQENKFIQAALDKVNAMLASQKESRATYLTNTFSTLITDLSQNSKNKESSTLLLNQYQQNLNTIQWSASTLNAAPMATKSTNAEQLLQQFQSILAKGNLSTTGSTQKMLIRLYPENLGALRIELIQKDNALVARILTSSAQAKELLDSQLNVLRQAFTMQNIQVDKLEINQSYLEQQNFLNKDQANKENDSQDTNSEEETETSFALNLESLLNEEVEI